jgi:hypothetical protein
MAKDRLEASTSVVFFKLYILAVTMVDQTDRRRQHELVLRENIVAQQVVMMTGRDFPKILNAGAISPSSSLHSPLSG